MNNQTVKCSNLVPQMPHGISIKIDQSKFLEEAVEPAVWQFSPMSQVNVGEMLRNTGGDSSNGVTNTTITTPKMIKVKATPTTTTATVATFQQMSPVNKTTTTTSSIAAKSTTLVDINRNGHNDGNHRVNNEHHNVSDNNKNSDDDDDHKRSNTKEPVTLVASAMEGKTVGKSIAAMEKDALAETGKLLSGVSIIDCGAHQQNTTISNGIQSAANGVETSKKLIIKCNVGNACASGEDVCVYGDRERDYNSGNQHEQHCEESGRSGQVVDTVGDGRVVGVGSDGDDDDDDHSSKHLESNGSSLSLPVDVNCASVKTAAKNRQEIVQEKDTKKETYILKIEIKPETEIENRSAIEKSLRKSLKLPIENNENCAQKSVESVVLVPKKELCLKIDKMVQKHPSTNNNNNNTSSGNTSVTDLNVSNPSYLYYMMSSGQFSPCETLDSGTGSDLESNGNNISTPTSSVGVSGGGANMTPKIEMHLTTTKLRKGASNGLNSATEQNGEHTRAGSLTDSEESEVSSLSCDSLHSTEFMRQSSLSPTGKNSPSFHTPTSNKGAFLPDSLLRDIRDRKFPTNDFESKYGNNQVHRITENMQVQDSIKTKSKSSVVQRAKNSEERQLSGGGGVGTNDNRVSLPIPVFAYGSDGAFNDTKTNSKPRKYEDDKYYDFHVNEFANCRSFGSNDFDSSSQTHNDDDDNVSEIDEKSMNDDSFAGYKDIGSVNSTIRSAKGTVRGVKNRVRHGIATFLNMQQGKVKNYQEKDMGRVVLYVTSMGVVRETYSKCASVKQILQTLLVKYDERDVFMSTEYQKEIKERMKTSEIKVPQLFVEGHYIGDAEVIERLNESGELRVLLKPYKSTVNTFPCRTCGGYRLLPCRACNGSKKSEYRNTFTENFVALKCMNCDEVGLVKCTDC